MDRVPLYDRAAGLVSRFPELYELPTLMDALRAGRARERWLATELLKDALMKGRSP